MKRLALIEKGNDGEYSIFSADTQSTIVGVGFTVEEAKEDFEIALKELIDCYTENGEPIPEELQGVEFEFKEK